MSKKEKLIQKLKSLPKDFTYEEVKALLSYLSYSEENKGKSSGSRVIYTASGRAPILLHKPHPRKELHIYQLRQIIDILEQEGLL